MISYSFKSAAYIFMGLTTAAATGACTQSTPYEVSGSQSAEVSASDVESVPFESATFSVEKMTCATCPATVRTAMRKVDGVKSVDVDFRSRLAVVSFDPSVTTISAIADASTNVGFPASLLETVQ
jgi:mercuric ion binding protein